MGQFQWDPESYVELIHAEVPDYDRLQAQVAAAAETGAESVLDLGTGTGESALRILRRNPGAHLVGIDASREMLARAQSVLPADRVRLLVGRLEDRLPEGPFDLVVSVLAVHHLNGAGKADLFRRIASVLAPRGRFVLGDVVVPDDPADVVTPIDGAYDKPSGVSEQVRWLQEAGLAARAAWTHRDLAVVVRPERFLEDPPDGYAYIPFGGGTHRCLGAALAMLELELFIEALVTKLEVEPAARPARPVRRGPILAPDNDGRIRVTRPLVASLGAKPLSPTPASEVVG